MHGEPGNAAALMLSAITNVILPKLYAMAAMWTLNSCEDIRTEAENGPSMYTIDLGTTVGGTPNSGMPRHLQTGETETVSFDSAKNPNIPKALEV